MATDWETARALVDALLPDNSTRRIKASDARAVFDVVVDLAERQGGEEQQMPVFDWDDLTTYFLDQWALEYPAWQVEADNAWQNTGGFSGYDYNHGNFILPAAMQFIQATSNTDVMDDAIDLIQAAIDNATQAPIDTGDQSGPPPVWPTNFSTSYWGWTVAPYVGAVANVNALTEYQWGVGAANFCAAIAAGRLPAATSTRDAATVATWNEATLDWIDNNICKKWWDVGAAWSRYTAYLRAFGGTALPTRTDWLGDKMWILADLGNALREGLSYYGKLSNAYTHANYATYLGPDEWLEKAFGSRWVYLDGDGSLQWDTDNSNVVSRTTLPPSPYYVPDTIHANRLARCVMNESVRRGYRYIPWNSYKQRGLANLFINRIWNGRTGDELLINNYTLGETTDGSYEYDYAGNVHGISGYQGWGWVYNGFNQIGCISPGVQRVCFELLALVRQGLDVSATYGRHSTSYGRVSLPAGLLWCNHVAQLWEEP